MILYSDSKYLHITSFAFVIFKILAKVFNAVSKDIMGEYRQAFNLPLTLTIDLTNKIELHYLLSYCLNQMSYNINLSRGSREFVCLGKTILKVFH